jgi:hypothetical protein
VASNRDSRIQLLGIEIAKKAKLNGREASYMILGNETRATSPKVVKTAHTGGCHLGGPIPTSYLRSVVVLVFAEVAVSGLGFAVIPAQVPPDCPLMPNPMIARIPSR